MVSRWFRALFERVQQLALVSLCATAVGCGSVTPEEEAAWSAVRGDADACALAREATLQGDTERAALAWMECLATGDGSTPISYVDTAQVLSAMGQNDDARGVLRAGQAAFPREPALHAARATLLMELDFHRAAESELEEGLVHDPVHLQSWLLLARARIALDRPTAALRALVEAERIGGRSPEVCLWTARAHSARGEDEIAAEWYEEALADTRRVEREILLEGALAFTQGSVTVDARRAGRAVLWADLALTQEECDGALFVRGLLHERMGELVDAQRCYERAADVNPENRMARERLAMLVPELAGR